MLNEKNGTRFAPVQNTQNEDIQAVLLTSSGKMGRACVAAYDLNAKQFVRFVADAATAAGIPFEEIRGLSAFDIVEVKAAKKCPIGPQTENVFVEEYGLRRIGKYKGTIEDIRKEIRYPDNRSLISEQKNRLIDISGYAHSLEIVPVRNVVLRKTKKRDGGMTTRAKFLYRDILYEDYRVTDFNYDLRNRKENEICIPFADLILSIPKEEYVREGHHYGFFKFIAAIYPVDTPKEEYVPAYAQGTPNNSRQVLRDMVLGSRPNSYEPWTEQEDRCLLEEFDSGMPVNSVAEKHSRTNGAIRSRLKKLGRIE